MSQTSSNGVPKTSHMLENRSYSGGRTVGVCKYFVVSSLQRCGTQVLVKALFEDRREDPGKHPGETPGHRTGER